MRGTTPKRAFRSATLIASVVAMASCGSSGNKPDAQAVATQPAATQASPTSAPATTAAATESASTTSASSTTEFVSEKYGFAVTLPETYADVDATVTWEGKHMGTPGSNQFADFPDFAAHRFLMGAATTVPAGTKLADWQATMVEGTPDVCPPPSPSSVQNTTLGGEPALLWTVKCSDGYDVIPLVALHGDQAYLFLMGSATANDDAEDQQIFDHARQSFRFMS